MRVPVDFTSLEIVPLGSPTPHAPTVVGGLAGLSDGSDSTYVNADQNEVDGEVLLHFGPVGISASRVTGIEWTIRGSALGVTFLGGSIFTVDGLFPDRLVINSERVHGATARTFNDDTMRDYTVVADPLVAKPTSTSPGEWTWFHQATLDEILADGGFVYLSGTRQGGATTYHWRITEFSLAFIVEARTPLRGRQRTSGTTGSIPLRGRNQQPYGLRGRQNADL